MVTSLKQRGCVVAVAFLGFRETRSNIDNIRKMLVQIDKPTKQVMIEAHLVEVSADPVQAYGINWAGTVGSASAPKTVAYGNPIASGSPVPGANPPTSGFSLGNPNNHNFFGDLGHLIPSTVRNSVSPAIFRYDTGP